MRLICLKFFILLSFAIHSQTDTILNGIIINNSETLTDSIQKGIVPSIKSAPPQKIDSIKHLTAFNSLNNFNNWAIKGKAMPWVSLLPGATGINYSAGLEFGFLKNNSLGIDLYYNRYSFDPPDVYDSVNNVYNGGYHKYILDKAIFLNYRHYLDFEQMQKKGITFYTGLFLRYGQLTFSYDKEYILNSNIVREYHYSLGLFLGILKEILYIKKIKTPINLDAYAGFFIKEKQLVKEYYDTNQNLIQSSDYPINGGVRIGLNISVPLRWKQLD